MSLDSKKSKTGQYVELCEKFEVLKSLKHDNIVKFYEEIRVRVGKTKTHYTVMEYLPEQDL